VGGAEPRGSPLSRSRLLLRPIISLSSHIETYDVRLFRFLLQAIPNTPFCDGDHSGTGPVPSIRLVQPAPHLPPHPAFLAGFFMVTQTRVAVVALTAPQRGPPWNGSAGGALRPESPGPPSPDAPGRGFLRNQARRHKAAGFALLAPQRGLLVRRRACCQGVMGGPAYRSMG
jgi:hypothetical protein